MARLKVYAAFLFICSRAKTKEDSKTETAAIGKFINASIGLAKDKDFTLLYSIISNDSIYIVTQS